MIELLNKYEVLTDIENWGNYEESMQKVKTDNLYDYTKNSKQEW
jgi:hypothetical protein